MVHVNAAPPAPQTDHAPEIKNAFEKGWSVIVWNDEVNQMNFVVYVFQKVLGFDRAKARKHMLEVHNGGKSCVAVETREKAEFYWQRIQLYGLHVTLERAA